MKDSELFKKLEDLFYGDIERKKLEELKKQVSQNEHGFEIDYQGNFTDHQYQLLLDEIKEPNSIRFFPSENESEDYNLVFKSMILLENSDTPQNLPVFSDDSNQGYFSYYSSYSRYPKSLQMFENTDLNQIEEYYPYIRPDFSYYLYWLNYMKQGIAMPCTYSNFCFYLNGVLLGLGWQDSIVGFQIIVNAARKFRAWPHFTGLLSSAVETFYMVYRPELMLDQITEALENIGLSFDVLTASLLDLRKKEGKLCLNAPILYALSFDTEKMLRSAVRDDHRNLFDACFPELVSFLDQWHKSVNGISLIDRFVKEFDGSSEQEYFQLPHEYIGRLNRKRQNLIYAAPAEKSFGRYLYDVYIVMENRIRKLVKNNSKRKIYYLEDIEEIDVIDEFVTRFFEKYQSGKDQPEQKKTASSEEVKLDSALIQDLRKQSDYVREALKIEEKADLSADDFRYFYSTLNTDEKDTLHSLTAERSVSGVAKTKTFIRSLQKKIRIFWSESWLEVHGNGQKIMIKPEIIDVVRERISENRVDLPVQIFQNDESNPVKPHADADSSVMPDTSLQQVKPEKSDSGVEFEDEEVEEFIRSLNRIQKKALRRIRDHNLYELESVADENFMLPEALVEQINETAFDVLGDMIIDPDTFELYEEYDGRFCSI